MSSTSASSSCPSSPGSSRSRCQHGVQRIPGARPIRRDESTSAAPALPAATGSPSPTASSSSPVPRLSSSSSSQRRRHPSHPALYRRRLRLVHDEPDRDDPALEPPPRPRTGREGARPYASAAGIVNSVGAVMSGTVLVVVPATKFIHGAGFAIAAMVVLYAIMTGIHRHYAMVERGSRSSTRVPRCPHASTPWSPSPSCTSRPSVRSPTPARPVRTPLEAVTVDVDPEGDPRKLQREWEECGIPVTLKALHSPIAR